METLGGWLQVNLNSKNLDVDHASDFTRRYAGAYPMDSPMDESVLCQADELDNLFWVPRTVAAQAADQEPGLASAVPSALVVLVDLVGLLHRSLASCLLLSPHVDSKKNLLEIALVPDPHIVIEVCGLA